MYIGQILKLSRGTQGISTQIAHTISLIQTMPLHVSEHIIPDTEADNLYQSISKKRIRTSQQHGTYTLGSPQQVQLDHLQVVQLRSLTRCSCVNYHVYSRIHVQSIASEVHSLLYNVPKKRNTYTICFKYNDRIEHGEVLHFVNVQHESDKACSSNIPIVAAVKMYTPILFNHCQSM